VAAYILAAVFDLISFGASNTVARDFFISGTHVLVAGLIVSVPTALTGFWDWLKSTPKHTQAWRTANWHMAVMLTVTAIVIVDILVRLANWDAGYAEPTVLILSLVAGGLVAFGALYGVRWSTTLRSTSKGTSITPTRSPRPTGFRGPLSKLGARVMLRRRSER
jgi:uncharacterized membrane protein